MAKKIPDELRSELLNACELQTNAKRTNLLARKEQVAARCVLFVAARSRTLVY